MANYNQSDICVTGIGITSSIGQGKDSFVSALLDGKSKFSVMQREGRQAPAHAESDSSFSTSFLGAEITNLLIPSPISQNLLRTASFSAQVALSTLHEAWIDAKLDNIDSERIGLIVGGSNFQQRELVNTHHFYQKKINFLRPTYALSFMDTDICGLCTEIFDIRGFAYSLGCASASSQVAIIQAIEAVKSGQVDVCIVIGTLMDLSFWECQGFRNIGAMGSDRFANEPEYACRPFDINRDGFIYGESCGVIVVENSNSVKRSGISPYARFTGWGMTIDGNRNPNPSFEGEVNAIQKALKQAQLTPALIDYINPHGTGSPLGDMTELNALQHCELTNAYINTTKSIIGHGLSAAGAVEIITILLQMKAGQLHPSLNLENPINDSFNWVQKKSTKHLIKNAINMSMGFGGINTALCLQRI